MTDFQTFKRIFDSSFWDKLSQSIIPFIEDEKPKKKVEFLQQLYERVINRDYSPSNPRGYIMLDKGGGVTRIVPSFSYTDYCIYFYCIKRLEDEIAINRIEGTFGGWRLGNPIRCKEQEEISVGESTPGQSFNPFEWKKNWKEFQKLSYKYSRLIENPFIVKLDIANFYDSINLNILEKKLRFIAGRKNSFEVDLLFNFLCNWNKRFEGYSRKTVGIPQDEISDCSRILANLYLQDYDETINETVKRFDAKYLRYADDQLIIAPNEEVANIIIVLASKELFKLNLNFNSSKVIKFSSLKEFDTYWAFELFDLLEQPYDYNKINRALELYFCWKDERKNFRSDSVLKKFLSFELLKIQPEYRYKLMAEVYKDKFLANTDVWYWNRILQNTENKNELFTKLDKLVPLVMYNRYHYNLLKFNKQHRKRLINEYIINRTKELSII